MSHLGQEPLRGGLAREQTCPNRSQGVLGPLPGTEKEVEAIQTLLQSKGWQVQPPYVQGKALKEILLTVQHPRVLHIATHGFFRPEADTVIDRTTCANCCREMKPTFSEKQIDRVARRLRMEHASSSSTFRNGCKRCRIGRIQRRLLGRIELHLGEVRGDRGVWGRFLASSDFDSVGGELA